jgi:hypothetical protein
MIESSARLSNWRGKCLSLLLTLCLAVNLLAPVNGLPQREGFIPICTGNESVYIPLGATDLDLQTGEIPAPASERCPWFANFHATEIAQITAGYSAVVYRAAQILPLDTSTEGQHTPASFQARAPPVPGA